MVCLRNTRMCMATLHEGDNDAIIIIIIIIIGKVKGKDHPITGHEGSGGSRGIALLVL